jgi:diguanylate cyclase (GGDEF)-like protein/PAS domain S-box-containing protein
MEASADGVLFEAAFRDAAIGMALVGLEGHWLKLNDALAQRLGYASAAELETLDAAHPMHPMRDQYAALFTLDEAERGSLFDGSARSHRLERCHQDRHGNSAWSVLTMSLVRSAAGEPSCFVAQVQDLGPLQRLETEARAFFEQSLDLLAIATLEGLFTRLNPSWQALLGYADDELTSRPFLEFVHPEDQERTLSAVAELKAGQEVRAFRNRYRAKDGSYHWLDWNARPIDDGRLFCVARDVTAHIEMEEQIRQASLVDELTGLSNRRGFFLLGEQALRAAVRHERNQLLCFLDLDGLKEINDELGHDQGDQALADIGEVLKLVFRQSDILARIGGDEFVTLAEGDGSAEISLRQRIGDELRRHNESGTRAYFLAASLGVAYYNPRRPVSLSELLLQADRQMYERKRTTRSGRPLAETIAPVSVVVPDAEPVAAASSANR